jgi:hypothetical protein
MKLVMIAYRFEYNDAVQRILDDNGVRDFIRHPRAHGGEADGKHDGSKVHPGHMAQVWARVEDDDLDALMDALNEFRQSQQAREHLTALVLGVERGL